MKRLIPFSWMLGCACCVSAQPTFEKYYESGASYTFDLAEQGSHNLFVAMGGAVIVDPEGNVIHNNYYWGDSILNLRSLKRYSDNEFYFVTGYEGDSCSAIGSATLPYLHPVIGRMDSLGNVLALNRYQLNAASCGGLAVGVNSSTNKSVIAWGGGGPFFALKADSTGAPVWAKQIFRHGAFEFIKELPGGDLLAGITMDTAGAVVARMDANGVLLWCKSYIRPRGIMHDAVIESDSSFIITGYTDSTTLNPFTPLPSSYHPKLFMLKLNGTGDVQWCRGYDNDPYRWYSPKWSRIKRTEDSSYVVLTTIGAHENNQNFNFFYRPFLMKTDQNGDTIWTRSAGVNGYMYLVQDLLISSDGGVLFDGTVWGDFPGGTSASYIFKADALGHLPCSEAQPPTISVSDLFPVDSSFTLSSVDGATVESTFVIDTVYGTIPVYDGCTITTVVQPVESRKLKVYPNPNGGHFTVQFSDPLVAESYYSVYDVMGRLLYQRPLPTGATAEEIDLSRFGKGTYVIKLTDPDGVCHERVVLE